MTRQAASYRGAGAARRRRRPRPLPARRPRPQRRRARRRREPGLEAGPSGEGDLAEGLLDTYHAERHPVGARVQHNTMAQVALTISDERHRALHDTMVELLAMDEPRKRIAAMITGLDIHYDFGHGHPLVGRRMPDLDLHTVDGSARVHPASRRVPCCSTSVISEVRHPSVGGSRPARRCQARRRVGAAAHRRGSGAPGRVDPSRRACRLGRRPHGPRAASSTRHLVRSGHSGLARDWRGLCAAAGGLGWQGAAPVLASVARMTTSTTPDRDDTDGHVGAPPGVRRSCAGGLCPRAPPTASTAARTAAPAQYRHERRSVDARAARDDREALPPTSSSGNRSTALRSAW